MTTADTSTSPMTASATPGCSTRGTSIACSTPARSLCARSSATDPRPCSTSWTHVRSSDGRITGLSPGWRSPGHEGEKGQMSIALLLTVLRRRWVVVAIGALLGLLLGVGMTKLMPASYSATASLVVSPVVTNPLSGAREDVNIRTEQEILGSREVAARASEILGIPADRDSFLLTQADVAAPSGSQVLQITVQSASPQQAA